MSADSVDLMLGKLLAKVEGIEKHLEDVRDEMRGSEEKADSSRAAMHRRLDDATNRMSLVEASVAGIESTISEVQSVTNDVKRMREQARGAGTMGSLLLRAGVGVLTVAGWIVAAYTYMTGRPPP